METKNNLPQQVAMQVDGKTVSTSKYSQLGILISNCTISPEDIKLIEAVSHTAIEHFRINEEYHRITDVLVSWCRKVGVTQYPSGQDLVDMNLFIQEEFYHLTVQELKLAANLSLTQKLEVDTRNYGQFTQAYVGGILQAYMKYRNPKLRALMEKANTLAPQEKIITQEEKINSFQEDILYLYDDYKNAKPWFYKIANPVYDFLKKHSLYADAKNHRADATKHGKNAADEFMKRFTSEDDKKQFKQEQVETAFAKDYVTQRFFDTLPDRDAAVKWVTEEVPKYYKPTTDKK